MIRNYNLDTIKFENLDEIENFLRKLRILKFDVIGVKKFKYTSFYGRNSICKKLNTHQKSHHAQLDSQVIFTKSSKTRLSQCSTNYSRTLKR